MDRINTYRDIEFLYRNEGGNDNFGKIKARFHIWYTNSNGVLYIIIEMDDGEIKLFNIDDCADIKFLS